MKPKPRLVELVAEEVRQRMLDGKWFSTAGIEREYGLSDPSVREVKRIVLSTEGVIYKKIPVMSSSGPVMNRQGRPKMRFVLGIPTDEDKPASEECIAQEVRSASAHMSNLSDRVRNNPKIREKQALADLIKTQANELAVLAALVEGNGTR